MKPVDSKHFCMAAFVHTMIDTVNAVKLCCASRTTVESINDNPSIIKIWNGDEYKKIRQDMIDDKPIDGCEICYKHEKENIYSDRQHFNRRFRNTDINIDTGNSHNKPISYDLRPNNLCNLKCIMCGPASSSQIAKEIDENPVLFSIRIDKHGITAGRLLTTKFNNDDWLDELEETILSVPNPDLKLLGGEPTLIPEHMRIMTKLSEQNNHNGKLLITTNLTNINNNFRKILETFNDVHIACSVDGYGTTLEYIRNPINYTSWRKNLDTLIEIRGDRKDFVIELHAVAQLFNLYHLPDFFKFAIDLNYNHKILFSFTNVLAYKERPTDVRWAPLEDRIRIANELEEISKTIPLNLLKSSRIRHVLPMLRDDSEPEQFEDKLLLANYVVPRDITRDRHIKDFIPEVYQLMEKEYDIVEEHMLKYTKKENTNE